MSYKCLRFNVPNLSHHLTPSQPPRTPSTTNTPPDHYSDHLPAAQMGSLCSPLVTIHNHWSLYLVIPHPNFLKSSLSSFPFSGPLFRPSFLILSPESRAVLTPLCPLQSTPHTASRVNLRREERHQVIPLLQVSMPPQ